MSARDLMAMGERNLAISAKRGTGVSRRELAEEFGLSIGQIDRIVNRLDVSIQLLKVRAAKWGMSLADYEAHVVEHGSPRDTNSPMRKFQAQRRGAKARGVAWNFTFPEWWSIWFDSGKWPERSRTGYVMARYNDGDTPYSPETVYICTSAQNFRDAAINVPMHTRRNARMSTKSGTGTGYSIDPRNGKNPYFVRFRRKAIGSFPTPELARAAYLAAANEYKRSRI